MIKKPLIKNCFKCQSEITIKWNTPRKCYVTKNNWDYWTENIEYKEKKICNSCIKEVCSDRYELLTEIKNPKKRLLLRNYRKTGLI